MADRRRVVLVLPTLVGGGAERVVGAVADELARQGEVDVELVSLLDQPSTTTTTPAGTQVRALGAPRVRSALRPLLTDLRARPPAAVLSTLKHVSIGLGLLWWRVPGSSRHVIRVANTYSSELAQLDPGRAAAARTLLRVSHRGAAAFVCGSVGVRDDLVTAFGLPAERCVVIPNPVDVDRVRRLAGAEEPDLPSAVADAATRFVAVGRLEPQKDHDTLLRAFAEVRRRHDAALVVVGDGSRRAALAALAAELDVVERVHFTGFVDNPYPWMRASTALVLSSRFEGSPNVLLEALALGLPCVATDCPHGPSEILVDPRLGRLVPVGEPVALAAAMAEVAEHPDPEAAAVRTDHVRRCHDLGAVAAAYGDVLLGRSGTGGGR
jgi:glycosyltransferase involved in cell wall biosynthesis